MLYTKPNNGTDERERNGSETSKGPLSRDESNNLT